MKHLVCRLLGHRWQPVANAATQHSVCLVCLRCRENGWQLRS